TKIMSRVADHLIPDRRMHAVAPDQEIRAHFLPARESDGEPVGMIGVASAYFPEVYVLPDPPQERVAQIPPRHEKDYGRRGGVSPQSQQFTAVLRQDPKRLHDTAVRADLIVKSQVPEGHEAARVLKSNAVPLRASVHARVALEDLDVERVTVLAQVVCKG